MFSELISYYSQLTTAAATTTITTNTATASTEEAKESIETADIRCALWLKMQPEFQVFLVYN